VSQAEPENHKGVVSQERVENQFKNASQVGFGNHEIDVSHM